MIMTANNTIQATNDESSRVRILVVDDEKMNRHYLSRLLSRQYDIETAEDGATALTMLNDSHFDIVLLDIMMPGISGLDVLKKIRNDPLLEKLPVILVSAMSDPSDVANGLDIGANDYITKPIDAPVLMARINTQLRMKELAEIQEDTITKLREADKLRSQMTHIASHDLKNPLHNMRMAQHLLREEIEDKSDRVTQLLDNLDSSLDTMYRVIEDYMDLVELKSDTIELDIETIWLWEAVMNVVAQYEIAAERKQVTLDVGDIPGDVRVDGGRLEQVIANLVSNAIKYSPFNSTVRIWSECEPECVRLYVQDEGKGVPEDERDLLFTEFAKTSTRPTNGEASTGLGLWIVKHLMTRQGGDAGATFPDEGGAIFWVDIPSASSNSVA